MATPVPPLTKYGAPVLVDSIISQVGKRHGLTPEHILSACRRGPLIWPRQLSIWLAVQLNPGKPLTCLVLPFNHRRGSIAHALQAVQNAIDVYPKAKAEADHWLKHFSSR